jgi:ATP-dependent DNA helicase RecQ
MPSSVLLLRQLQSSGIFLKNLDMSDATTFKASFNRPNLYYEVRTKKKNVESDIIRFIKQHKGSRNYLLLKSQKKEAIVKCCKLTDKCSTISCRIGRKTRARHQDMFLWKM